MKKSELIQIIKEEIQKLLKEETKIDKQGNIIYSLYDENSDWDFSDSETFMITWTLDKDVPNRRVQRKFEWDDEDFNIEISIKDIQTFLKDPTKSTENFKVSGGYVSLTKKEANDVMDSYYENWPDEINPDLNETYMDNFSVYENEFKKRGFKRTNEDYSSGGYDDLWYKDLTLGRFCVLFSSNDLAINSLSKKYQQFTYSIWFEPFPKFEKKFFSLLKSKNPQWGKMINYENGEIDFGEGLFKIDDEKFIVEFFNKVDKALSMALKITSVKYLSPEESKDWGRPAFSDMQI